MRHRLCMSKQSTRGPAFHSTHRAVRLLRLIILWNTMNSRCAEFFRENVNDGFKTLAFFFRLRSINQSNQSNPVLLKERVHIPRTRCAGGAAMLWGALPLDRVGSCRLFFTDDLHDTLSWVPASDKPHTFKSCFTHSSQVFFGRPGPFLPGTGLDLTLFISPLERMTCPNHLSWRSRTRTARSHRYINKLRQEKNGWGIPGDIFNWIWPIITQSTDAYMHHQT